MKKLPYIGNEIYLIHHANINRFNVNELVHYGIISRQQIIKPEIDQDGKTHNYIRHAWKLNRNYKINFEKFKRLKN